MIRKLILSVVLATGTCGGLALSATAADAHAPSDFHRHRFEVLVHCGHGWEVRGVYPDHFEAERFAQHLRREGFRVEIREW